VSRLALLALGTTPVGHAVAARAPGLLAQSSTTSSCLSPSGARSTSLCTETASLHVPIAYRSILPVLILGLGALLLLLIGAVLPKRTRPGLWSAVTAAVGGASLLSCIYQWIDIDDHGARLTIAQQVAYDHFSVFFMVLVSSATVLGALLADSYLQREGLDGPEAYVLLLLAGSGAMLMAAGAGLIMLFLGLEIMSIALYVLSAYHRRRAESGEAGLKYFILGSFSSAIFLYGVALIYGATGSTQYGEIASFLAANTIVHSGVLLAGMVLLIVGLGFKVAAVPFHFWTPDVYQGAPTPFTAYMAAVAKAAGFAGLIRVLFGALPSQQSNWRPIIWALAVLTLLVGSVLAIVQTDLKRMLAYSSIGQAGYVLIGVEAASAAGSSGALFYLLTYTFIVIGSFAVVQVVQGPGEARDDLGAIRGLSKRRPWLALTMLLFLLAQAGVPLTSGFLAKFYVIGAAVGQGQYPLAIIGMLAAAVAAFFYLRVALLMYSSPQVDPATEPTDGTTTAGLAPPLSGGPRTATVALQAPPEERVSVPVTVSVVLAVCAAFTVFAGVAPNVIDFAKQATQLF
jgi:NADH-quinone oxidoreductase subunit N